MRKTTEKEQEKRENQDTDRNQEVIEHMASVLMNSLIRTNEQLKEYKEFMDTYVDNPFYFDPVGDIINFKEELKEGFQLPYFISRIVFKSDIIVKAIEIKGSDIYIYYHNKGVETEILDRYIINLDWKRLPIRDLFMVIFILYNMPMNNASDFSLSLQWFKDYIEQEKNTVIKMLKNNGIEINN